jgi:lipopolysaccharide transport protein LptA
MSRSHRPTTGKSGSSFGRAARTGTGFGFALLIFLTAGALNGLKAGAAVAAPPKLRIAVAPFAGEGADMAVARAFTGQLASRQIERLIAPGEFVASTLFEPRAAEVRRWAYNSAVDTIVVGRVSTPRARKQSADPSKRERVIEVVLHSGHSGAEMSRHEIVVPGASSLDPFVEALAVEILAGLGHVDSPTDADRPKDGKESASSDSPDATEDADDDPLAAQLSHGGFRSETPIEIKADEAEIIDRDDGRKLVFKRHVTVRQDNVTLRSDRLEASYRKGESEPHELIAEGQVRIAQGDRRAKCDRAAYLREDNQLTCHGRAELMQGCDIVRGDSIRFDLGGDQARVEGAASVVILPKREGQQEGEVICPANGEQS